MKKVFYLGLVAGAIALSANSLSAKESYSQNSSDTIFVCTTENATSTMYAYTPGNAVLTPVMSWYKEYLLPETSSGELCKEVAGKLQDLSQEKKVRYIATEEQSDQNVVCMVARENANCSDEDSQKLFGINLNYQPNCILDRLEPLECSVTIVRGGILSNQDSPYTPTWWPW